MTHRPLVLALIVAVASASGVLAQGRGGPPQPAANPRAGALIDLAGYWVSVVTEDWRWRMVTPPKGDYASVPMTREARAVADAWDISKTDPAWRTAQPGSCAFRHGFVSRGSPTPSSGLRPMPESRRGGSCSTGLGRQGHVRSRGSRGPSGNLLAVVVCKEAPSRSPPRT